LYYPDMDGCSDGGCIFKRNTGMVTNGGCICERELLRSTYGVRAIKTILYLRKQIRDAELDK